MEFKLTDGTHLRVRLVGEGEIKNKTTSLLVHGWGVSGNLWDTVLKQWPKNAGLLVAPDLRGSGWSGKPHTGYTLEQHAQDMIELMNYLGLGKISLLGHSMGGAIAQLIACKIPDRVSKLILVSPVPASGIALPNDVSDFFRSGAGHYESFEKIARSSMAVPPSEVAYHAFLSDAASVTKEAYLEGFEAWKNASFAEQLQKITAETIVFGGEAEPYLPAAFLQDQVVSKIKGARFVSIPLAGHYPQLETPDAFQREVVQRCLLLMRETDE